MANASHPREQLAHPRQRLKERERERKRKQPCIAFPQKHFKAVRGGEEEGRPQIHIHTHTKIQTDVGCQCMRNACVHMHSCNCTPAEHEVTKLDDAFQQEFIIHWRQARVWVKCHHCLHPSKQLASHLQTSATALQE